MKGFAKHTEWNGCTLLKQIRDSQSYEGSTDDYPQDRLKDYEEERKVR